MAREAELVGAPDIPAVELTTERKRRRVAELNARTLLVTTFAVVVLAAFLSPMLRTVTTALKSQEQITQIGAPLWPAEQGSFEYQGREYDVYRVPIGGGVRDPPPLPPGGQG